MLILMVVGDRWGCQCPPHTFVAYTLKAPRHVPAPTVPAYSVILGALIHVKAVTAAVILPVNVIMNHSTRVALHHSA